jgi:hypothetical protein
VGFAESEERRSDADFALRRGRREGYRRRRRVRKSKGSESLTSSAQVRDWNFDHQNHNPSDCSA